MEDKLRVFENRLVKVGLSIVSITGFLAYFFHEMWRILSPFFER